jgi:tetratricopeptide (TPR) repeat protein
VFWVHAGTRARFEEGYRRIAEATKMNGWNDKKVDILQLVRSWLCDESNGQWTMVIDNADDADVFFNNGSQNLTTGNLDESAELLSNFLPQSPNGSILVTSRNQDVAQKLIGASSGIVEVKPMDTGNALALLEKKLGFIAAKDDAMRLICALDFMPLAITQAAAFINQRAPRMSLSRYVDEVGRSDKDRARLLKKDVGDSRRDGQASNSIIATWQISFEHIRKQVPTAARLLSLMSMFDRQGIPESLLLDQYGDSEEGEVDFEDDIHTLCSFCLIEMSEDGREFEMHQLVQFSTKKWLELCSELEKWRATYAALMDASFPVGQHENWPVCHALFPHALAMVSNKPQDTLALEMWASVLFKAAWYVRELGQYRKAIELDFIALEVRRNVLGAEHPDTLNSLDSLGLVLEGQGNYREAETVHHQVMEVRERVLGPDDPSTLTSISNLASTYRKQGRWKDAEELFVIVLETRKIKLGVEHPHTLTSMAKLASTYWDQGRWKDAEDLDVQVLETRKTKLGESHPDTLVSMANLATTYGNQGRWDEAEELELQVLETRKIKLGEDHPQTLGSIANLASTYKEQGRWNDAEELEVQVLETRKTKLGESHPDTLVSMANLATTYGNQGRLDDAEELELQVLETRKTKLGEDHPDTLTSMANLAITYGNQDRWDDAQELEIQVLETRKAKLGEDHPDTLDSKANLASTYWRQGRWDDVEELEVQVLETRKTKFGEGHPDTLAIMNNLAVTWRWQGNHTKALDLMRECVQICRRVLGASHPETIASSATLSIWEAEQMDTTTEAMARDVQI